MLTSRLKDVAFPPEPLSGIKIYAELFVPPNGDEATVTLLIVDTVLYVIGPKGPPVEQQSGPPATPMYSTVKSWLPFEQVFAGHEVGSGEMVKTLPTSKRSQSF